MLVNTCCLPAITAHLRGVVVLRSRMSNTNQPSPDRSAHNLEDARLMQRVARGDRSAFAQIHDRFSRPLFATALRILNDSAEAEDVLQEVFLSLWEKSADFNQQRGSAFSWAVTLTRNRSIDRIRMRQRRGVLLSQSVPEDLGYAGPDDSADSTADLESKETAAKVRTAVKGLPAEQQKALQLAFFSGMTQQEIATTLREPLGTIKARIRRGLLKLRENFALQQ
jgi:RNA polymerase sigma-70 factor, ECF subfamily